MGISLSFSDKKKNLRPDKKNLNSITIYINQRDHNLFYSCFESGCLMERFYTLDQLRHHNQKYHCNQTTKKKMQYYYK